MRVEMFGCAIAMSVLFSGQVPVLKGSLTHAPASPPAWLSIPADADVAAIEFTGKPGHERTHGEVVVRAGSETVAVVKTIATSLARDGVDITQHAYDRPQLDGTRTIIAAFNPETGRSAALAVRAGVTGNDLRIIFADSKAR
jgi:hypothetical protein